MERASCIRIRSCSRCKLQTDPFIGGSDAYLSHLLRGWMIFVLMTGTTYLATFSACPAILPSIDLIEKCLHTLVSELHLPRNFRTCPPLQGGPKLIGWRETLGWRFTYQELSLLRILCLFCKGLRTHNKQGLQIVYLGYSKPKPRLNSMSSTSSCASSPLAKSYSSSSSYSSEDELPCKQRSSSGDQPCWICFGSDGDTRMACKCPRQVHPKCLARWQLQQAGKS
jgi:hypothetical protein